MMYKHPKNYFNWGWGSLRKSRLVLKNSSSKSKMFCKRNILRKHPKIAKKCIQSLKNWDFCFFPIFTEGIKAKLTELESESESFLSKVKIYHFHLPITT